MRGWGPEVNYSVKALNDEGKRPQCCDFILILCMAESPYNLQTRELNENRFFSGQSNGFCSSVKNGTNQ